MSADPNSAFVGAWRLIHSVEHRPSGERHYPFGEDAMGYIIYSESGGMAGRSAGGGVQRRERIRSSARRIT